MQNAEKSDLLTINDKLREENEKLIRIVNKQAEKLRCVGVRWYGNGSFTFHLEKVIGGMTELVLSPENREGVIDFKTWLKIAKHQCVTAGVLVRDDSVISELGVDELSADANRNENPNAFTDAEGLEILNLTMTQLKKRCAQFTDKFPYIHLYSICKTNSIENKNILAFLKEQYHKLDIADKYKNCNRYELFDAARMRDIDYERMTEKDICAALIAFDIKDMDTTEDL